MKSFDERVAEMNAEFNQQFKSTRRYAIAFGIFGALVVLALVVLAAYITFSLV